MNATLPLSEMSVEEKLKTIEIVWNDLLGHEDEIPVPKWHQEALADAEKSASEGRNELVEWETAKKRLRSRFA